MWMTRKKQPPIRTLVGESVVVRGEIRFCDGLRVDGEVHGNIVADAATPSLLVISENARVTGTVKAGHVIIWGFVSGTVVASERIEIQPKARVEANVRYEVLELHPGAIIDGELKPLKTDEKPALILAASNES